MKAIINGRRYNTETATLIGEASSNYSYSDFKHWSAGLYKTKNGRFFLAGDGGPMTRWARSVGNGYTGGSGIHPLDTDEAREWAEQHLSTNEIEAAFANQIEEA